MINNNLANEFRYCGGLDVAERVLHFEGRDQQLHRRVQHPRRVRDAHHHRGRPSGPIAGRRSC